MKFLALATLVGLVVARQELEPAARQIVDYKEKTKSPVSVMTTSNGAPVEYQAANGTLNKPLIFNEYFMESLNHIVRASIPPRIVHAKAAGAFGYFEVTHDITDICKSDMFKEVGKKTPIAVRFSPISQDVGGIDTPRDGIGFAIKFYTDEGNFDIAGLNQPMYLYKDPLFFLTFTRAQGRNPATNLHDPNMFFDALTLHPEGFNMFLRVFSDKGIPDGYRHMSGYSIHTMQLANKNGDQSYARFHFIPDAGYKNLLPEQASKIQANDCDYATRDLYNAIGKEDFPSWTVKLQVLTLDDVKSAGFDVFDVTKVLPLKKYPLRPVGRFMLNKNPKNYFAEIEQLAFNPANLVPGILGAPDKLFEARLLSYRNAQYHRMGANFNQVPVNCPLNTVLTYNRNGIAAVDGNGQDMPNYYPNSFNGPAPYTDELRGHLIEIEQDEGNNYVQATELYENELTEEERGRLVENILNVLRFVLPELQDRTVEILTQIHNDLGSRISKGLMDSSTTI